MYMRVPALKGEKSKEVSALLMVKALHEDERRRSNGAEAGFVAADNKNWGVIDNGDTPAESEKEGIMRNWAFDETVLDAGRDPAEAGSGNGLATRQEGTPRKIGLFSGGCHARKRWNSGHDVGVGPIPFSL